jgi:hypothetical protein
MALALVGPYMTLKEIIDCCSEFRVKEKRCLTEEFIELVFVNDEISNWQRVLVAFLGPPIKPGGQAPSENDLARTANTGGIRIEQTLYEKEFDGGAVIAKFWPWKDNIHTTLRMALLVK